MSQFQELTSMDYLRAEIACKHDKAYEKLTWDERIKHFNLIMNEANFEGRDLIKEASDPIGLQSAINTYHTAEKGEAIGYQISLDACASGLQLLSLLSGCEKSFSLCGGLSDRCVDSYVEMYENMGLGDTLSRKEVKQAIMTAFYGSTATPKHVFADNVDIFYETMETMAPGAWDLNVSLQDLWEEIEGSAYSWNLPDNFHAHVETHIKEFTEFTFLDETFEVPTKVAEKPKFHKGLGPNLVHSVDAFIVREMAGRCMFDQTKVQHIIESLNSTEKGETNKRMVQLLWWHYQASGILSVRILDYLTAETMGYVDPLKIAILIQSMPEKPFDLLTIHDCFKCLPKYGNNVRKQYNNIMAEISESRMLEYIVRQVTDNPDITVNKHGTIDPDTIRNGNYLLA